MRKYGFILFSLVIIAIFFGAFFLYYVPYNKEAQNKYAFLVLKNIESNLQFRIQASIDLFSNNLQRSFNNDTLSAKALDTLKPKLTELRAAVIWRTFNAFRNYNVIKTTSGLPTGELYDISYDSIIYQMSQGKDSLRLFSPLSKMADDILRPHKNDFFQYFLFLKIKDSSARPVFQSDGLDLGTEIEVDSLLPGSKTGFYEGITDVPLGDADYKMFYIPVNINGRHFAICGFKNAGEYLSSLHQVPSKFIYPIVIALLLVLIILPLIKLYIMGPNESIRIWDFAGYFSALFIGSTFLTIVIIQVVLLKDSDIRSRRNLKKLSEQISKSFQKEISKAYDRLNSMDLVPLDDPTYDTTTFWPGARIDVSKTLNKWLKERPASDSTYYNFDRIAWTNNSGMQIIKGEIDQQSPLFTKISTRKYFQAFSTGDLEILPGTDTALFSLEPVYTWIDGSFRMVIAKRSLCPRAYIVHLSLIMYSFSQTILPPGYGYAMIGDDGVVQVHSDSSHNLNENFFDELDDNRALKGALKARQELFIPQTKFYGKENAVFFTPVSKLPLYLITFYDTGNIQPVNMRILIFSFIFSFLFFIICLVLWVILFWRRFSGRPLVFTTMDYLNRLIPRRSHAQFYVSGFIFMSFYVLAMLVTAFLTNRYAHENNHMILILLLQTPITITCGLIIISGAVNSYRDRNSGIALLSVAVMNIACLLWCIGFDLNVLIQQFTFSLLVFLILCFVYFYPDRLKALIKEVKEKNYMAWYTRFLEAMVVCLAVLPAGLFSWYANNQEIIQEIKKEQLCQSISLENRRNGIYGQLDALGNDMVPKSLIDTLKYQRGIYNTISQHLFHDIDTIPVQKYDLGYERFYFDISNEISNDYYSSGYLPALRDHSRDRIWAWEKPTNDSLYFHFKIKPSEHPHQMAGVLHIQSEIPDRFVFLSGVLTFIFLLVVVGIILYLLYILIFRISAGVFLKKYVEYGYKLKPGQVIPLFLSYCSKHPDSITGFDHLHYDLKDVVFDFTTDHDERQMDVDEQWVITQMEVWKDYYAHVLESCTPSEKYLLYHFVSNGFINYKNAPEIYHLLDRSILLEKDGAIRLFSLGFRAYILKYYSASGDLAIQRTMKKKTAWQSFKTPFMILLVSVAAFIFFTQQEAWQRFSALIAGLSTSIPLLIGIFKGSNRQPADSK